MLVTQGDRIEFHIEGDDGKIWDMPRNVVMVPRYCNRSLVMPAEISLPIVNFGTCEFDSDGTMLVPLRP